MLSRTAARRAYQQRRCGQPVSSKSRVEGGRVTTYSNDNNSRYSHLLQHQQSAATDYDAIARLSQFTPTRLGSQQGNYNSTASRTFATKVTDNNNSKNTHDANAKTDASTISTTTQSKDDESSDSNKSDTDSLRDTLNRLRQDNSNSTNDGGSNNSSINIDKNAIFRSVADLWSKVKAEIDVSWQEFLKSGQRKDINKKIHPEFRPENDRPYEGPVELMTIDPAEHLTAWERMQRRLTEAPIIQDILTRTQTVYEKSGAKQVKQKLDHLSEDAREVWETSQNPWVYRVSSVYDTLTAEPPQSIALKELRKLDPDFTYEEWQQDVIEHTLPQIMSWLLEGRINQLKPWLGEGIFKRFAAEITARQKEGVQIDTHVLGIINSEIVSVTLDEVEKGSPIILLHFMVQQINCVKNKKDGKIVEGAEDDIRANSYLAAFQREYDKERGELNWKIVDFRFNGAIAYL